MRLGRMQLSSAERATIASEAARASGRQSNGSSRPTPASGQAITLRNVWPQADRLVSPQASTPASTWGTEAGLTWCSSMFCRVERWTHPIPCSSTRSATAKACTGVRQPPTTRTRTMNRSDCTWVQTPYVFSA